MEFGRIFILICIISFTAVDGCGVLPAGREKTITFTVTDFKLPAVMVYSVDPAAKTKVSTISTSRSEAETFARKLIKETVEDVLYQQGRSAFLTDSVISSILQQLNIQVNYDPLECKSVLDTTMAANALGLDQINCIIIGGTVTNICTNNAANMCMLPGNAANYKSIDPKYTTISGKLTTTNGIMANWSNQMWESVLNRVLRSITSRANGSYFFGASLKLN